MKTNQIHIPGRKKNPIQDERSAIIRISKEAYNGLVELYNETYLSMSALASTILLQAMQNVVIDKEEGEQDAKTHNE